MPNKKITQLGTASTPLTGTELLEAVQAGVNVQLTTQDVADLGGGGGTWGSITGTLSAQTDLQTALDDRDTRGAQDLWITAPAMWPTVTSGCAESQSTETGGKTYKSLDFDSATDENAQFQFSLPRNWNNGTILATVYWTASAGSGTVQFEISAVALSNDDPFSTSFGTAVAIDDTLIATNDVHISPTSSAITIGGTPADGDLIMINVMRDVSDDTLNADAKLLGIRITITLDASVSQ